MSLYDILVSVDARTALMNRMMVKFGIDRTLRSMAHHGEVTARAVDRCRACGHQGECAEWLDRNDQPDIPPSYCRNADVIARLRRAADASWRSVADS